MRPRAKRVTTTSTPSSCFSIYPPVPVRCGRQGLELAVGSETVSNSENSMAPSASARAGALSNGVVAIATRHRRARSYCIIPYSLYASRARGEQTPAQSSQSSRANCPCLFQRSGRDGDDAVEFFAARTVSRPAASLRSALTPSPRRFDTMH